MLYIYSDGGPDHRVTFLSVKLALVAFFRRLDLDYLCAALYHSYRNPVERIMILNLGLQAVALARARMAEEMEAEASRCNTMKPLRAMAERTTQFLEVSMDAIFLVKVLLSDMVERLELKENKFIAFAAASDS